MKNKQVILIFALLVLVAIGIGLFFLQGNLLEEKTRIDFSSTDVIDSKRDALDFLGGLVNEGFHVRDEAWEVFLTPKKMELLELTLFAGNQYWFAVSASTPAKRLKLALYDDEGNPVKLDLKKNDCALSGACLAGGLLVSRSGNYYVGLELLEERGKGPVRATLVYAYH
jgi:hypothetical protein